ncbi:winged helix-turn-helix transcriptional regulator [Planktomarina temperata]|nr:winged helix-turn-helix transcriptional regulator [Planktomarina temperata]
MLDLKTGVDEKFVEENMCPIGLAAHLLGDKWIPIIIRDIALFNRRTFNDILKNNRENISSGSLSSRLKLMLDLNLLEIGTSERHAQKKPYYLTEAGISFVPILFNLAAWTTEFRTPAADIVALAKPYLTDGADRMEWLLEQLRTFNIHKTKEPEPLWWA